MIFKNVGTVIPIWNVQRVDPGYLYIFESNDRYKIGKTKSTAERLKAAKTWLPDMTLIGFKPFWGVSYHERQLHTGFAQYWYSGEWFEFGKDHDARNFLIEEFVAFTDDDPDKNSVDIIYFYHGGIMELQIEMHRQKLTLPKFQKQISSEQKKRS